MGIGKAGAEVAAGPGGKGTTGGGGGGKTGGRGGGLWCCGGPCGPAVWLVAPPHATEKRHAATRATTRIEAPMTHLQSHGSGRLTMSSARPVGLHPRHHSAAPRLLLRGHAVSPARTDESIRGVPL